MIWALLLSMAVSATEIRQHGGIFVSGTPSEQELAQFKKQNGGTVLDLRAIDELGNCSEPAASAKLGLRYNRVNFEKKPAIDAHVVRDIDEAVRGRKGKPILLFCKTGNRAAAWVAIHMVRTEGASIEAAVAEGRRLGMKDDMEKAVRDFLR